MLLWVEFRRRSDPRYERRGSLSRSCAEPLLSRFLQFKQIDETAFTSAPSRFGRLTRPNCRRSACLIKSDTDWSCMTQNPLQNDPRHGARLSEFRVFGQKAVAGMNCVDPCFEGDPNHIINR